MESNALSTTHPTRVWLREICQRWELVWLFASPLVTIRCDDVESTDVRHCREALRIAIKPRLVGWETEGVRTEAPLRLSRRPRTGL